uniref:Uncharacterized protein n=1 Tax=Anguilla anguilla TaxID=7936 RepID=A0A0E9T9P7_ANGAN
MEDILEMYRFLTTFQLYNGWCTRHPGIHGLKK